MERIDKRFSDYHRRINAFKRMFTFRIDTSNMWTTTLNPLAREVLDTSYRMLPRDTVHGPVFDDPENTPFEIHRYQLWVTEKLPNSGLAKALAAGLGLLADPTDDLPWPWKYLAKRYSPRNYRQLTRMVVSNLEWYLDQSRKLQDPWTRLSERLPITFYSTFVLYIAFIFSTSISKQHWLVILAISSAIFIAVLMMNLFWGRSSHKHRTNCAEFYHYLIKEYDESEVIDPDRDYHLVKNII